MPDEVLCRQISFLAHQSEEFKTHFICAKTSEKKPEVWTEDLIRQQCPANAVQVTVQLVVLQRLESIEENFWQPYLSELKKDYRFRKQSIVKGITYGAKTFLVLQQELNGEQDCHLVEGELLLAVKSFYNRPMKAEWQLEPYPEVLDQVRCYYYSDLTENSHEPITFRQYCDSHLQLLLQNDSRVKWEAQEMILEPLDADANNEKITHLRHTTEGYLAVLESYINHARGQILQMAEDPFLDRILFFKEHIQEFHNALNSFHLKLAVAAAEIRQVDWMQHIPEGSRFVSEAHSLCFLAALCDDWLAIKRREIAKMKLLLRDTDLKVQTSEQIYQTSTNFQVFQLKITWVQDRVINAIRYLGGQPEQYFACVYEVAISSEDHFDAISESLHSFALEGQRTSDIFFGLSTSFLWSDGSIVRSFTPPKKTVTPPKAEEIPKELAQNLLADRSPNNRNSSHTRRPKGTVEEVPDSNTRGYNGYQFPKYRNSTRRPNYSQIYQPPKSQERSITVPDGDVMQISFSTGPADCKERSRTNRAPKREKNGIQRKSESKSEGGANGDEVIVTGQNHDNTAPYKNEPQHRVTDAFLKNAQQLRDGRPAVYLLKGDEKVRESLRWIHIGQPDVSVPHKTILLMGATGSGKSTLVDAMINYILGVGWKDPFRFKIVPNEGNSSQSSSQTRTITAYTIHHTEGFKIPHTLTIIDTPGYGDTEGLTTDEEISRTLCNFLTHQETTFDQVDAVCFVASSADARLTPTQEYVISSVLSIFGKDMSGNIRLLATFCDGAVPPVVEACRQANFPFLAESISSSFVKFNNSVLFTSNAQSGGSFDKMIWDMTNANFGKFFEMLSSMKSKSLEQTRNVIHRRMQLDKKLKSVHIKLEEALSKVHKVQTVVEKIGSEAQVQENVKPQESKVRKTCDRDWLALNCFKCRMTCSGPIKGTTKSERKVILDKKCSCNCSPGDHEFQDLFWEKVDCKTEEVSQTAFLLAKHEKEVAQAKNSMLELFREMAQVSDQLERTALRYSAPTAEEFVKSLQSRLASEVSEDCQSKVDILGQVLDKWKSGETF